MNVVAPPTVEWWERAADPASGPWKCFFCGEIFFDRILAAEHFGSEYVCVTDPPGCVSPLRSDEKARLAEVKAARDAADWTVAQLRKFNPAAAHMVIEPEDAGDVRRAVPVKVHPYFFEGRERELSWDEVKEFDQLTFGYALTVHKSQGSQWKNVILFDEGGVFRDDAVRWRYTGITRAAEKLIVVM